MTTTKPFALGSISTGTLKTEDLISTLEAELEFRNSPDHVDFSGMNDEEYVARLVELLNELCPPFVYFGAHPDDGANFGFWPDWDDLQFWKDQYHLKGCIVSGTHQKDITVMDLDRNILWSTV